MVLTGKNKHVFVWVGGGEVVAVHELLGVSRDRLGDLGVAVAEGRHVDAARKVDILVAVDVLHHAPLALLEGDGEEPDLAGNAAVRLLGARMERGAFGPRYLARGEVGDSGEVEFIRRGIVLAHLSNSLRLFPMPFPAARHLLLIIPPDRRKSNRPRRCPTPFDDIFLLRFNT